MKLFVYIYYTSVCEREMCSVHAHITQGQLLDFNFNNTEKKPSFNLNTYLNNINIVFTIILKLL